MDRRNKNRAEREVHEASLSSNAELCAAEVSEQDEPSSEPDASESRKVAASLTSACMDGPFAATARTRAKRGNPKGGTSRSVPERGCEMPNTVNAGMCCECNGRRQASAEPTSVHKPTICIR